MEMVTVHFSKEELACKCGCGLLPPPGLLKKVEKVRQRYGRPLSVASGARCPDYNAKVSGTGRTGPHTKGAIDFRVSGENALYLVQLMIEEGFTGIGVSQKGPHAWRFIHGDDLPNAAGQPRPTIWSY